MQLELIDGIWRIVKKEQINFLHADNMAFLRWCKENEHYKYFHCGIVDPPYGIDVTKMNLGATKDSKPRTYKRGEWDGEVPTQEYWDLLWYCCRNLVVWGGNYFTNNYGKSNIPSGRCFVVWDKGNDNMSFAPAELAISTFDQNAIMIRKPRNSKTEDDGDKRHDTQKPVYLYDKLHLDFNLRGKRVLDTHGGSHTHACAAYKNNVQLTIMDKELSYHLGGIKAYENSSIKGQLLF